MALQNERNFPAWFREIRNNLRKEALIGNFSKKRDQVVHREMLVPNSRVEIGVTELRGMKFGMTFPVHPLEDSDVAMERYLTMVKRAADSKQADFLGILLHDDDSMPCVRREWGLVGFDGELVDLCARGFLLTSEMLLLVLRWLGEDPPQQTLNCRRQRQELLHKYYDRSELIKRMKNIKL
jgi:hypothetical protein